MFSHTLTTALEQLCPLSHDSCLNFFERVTLMHELYRVLSAISADTFSQHFRTYFIIPCNPTFYKHLKLLRRPQRSVDIRTAQTRQGSNTQETCCPLDDPFILVTYPHFICIANSFSTKKEDIHTGYPQKASTRRDSNPRPSPWQGDTPPLSHSCTTYLQNHILKSIFTVSSTNQTFLDKPSTD